MSGRGRTTPVPKGGFGFSRWNPLLELHKIDQTLTRDRRHEPILWSRAGAVLLMVASLAWACSQTRSDDDLLAHFRANREAYESLVEMTRADNITMIQPEPDWFVTTQPPGGELSARRLGEYRALFLQLGVHACWRDWPKSTTRFMVSEARWSGQPISAKGIAYAESPTELDGPIVKNLDKRAREDGTAYRAIEGPWYVYFGSM